MRKPLYVIALTLMLALSSIAFAADAPKSGVVNINNATAAQLALLPGIGEKAAQRIIDYRTQHGPFAKTSDLMEVKGVGEKTFERLAPHVALSGDTTLTAKIRSPRKPRATQPAPTAAN